MIGKLLFVFGLLVSSSEGETVHRGVKCHNEGISLNLIRTQHSRSSRKCPEAMFMCEHLGVSPGSNEKESVTGALLEL
ncbi:hypothetical protein Q7C36_008906 [Tachysurus vachellii]|uniref:Secreted protein n=1 Tax=Tachysurus vachellii TaxID=175792 RepID=A0AA88N500_TACVA|nr:hypothetical protein Q7C36_008906 [Tachysurus vachellii]